VKIGVCIRGLENIAAEEVKGKKVAKGRVSFEGDIKNFKSIKLVYDLIDSFIFKTKLELVRNISKKLEFKGSFRVLCNREGEHKFDSGWVMSKLHNKIENDYRVVKYKDPERIIYVDIVEDKCLFGVLIKKDMYKRNYRVKLRGSTVHPCVAYSMLKLIDLKSKETFLEPRCGDGVIAIEAALLGAEVTALDRNIRDVRINAKIAKVELDLQEGKLDTLNKKKFDKIATYLPSVSKIKREGMISGIYEEFFLIMKKILKGRMAILVEKKKLVKKFSSDFKLLEERKISVGNSGYYILIFE